MYPNYLTTATQKQREWMWRPILNQTYDGRYVFSANVSIPQIALQGSSLSIRRSSQTTNVVIYAGSNNGTVSVPGSVYCIDLSPGNVALSYSNTTYTPASVGDSYDKTNNTAPKTHIQRRKHQEASSGTQTQ
jgi:hypothetical protein